MNVFEWSAAELAQKIKAGELSAPEAVEAVIAAIDTEVLFLYESDQHILLATALITATPH